MNCLSRRSVIALIAGLAGATGTAALEKDTYPDRSITLVVPYPPGGFTDILGRLLAQKLQSAFGQTVVVENKGGGGSTIGTSYVARSRPDGYTLLLVAPDFAINESLLASRLSYDAQKDFAPVMQAAWSPMVLVVNAAVPVKNVAELIALAKAKPGQLNVASGGNGTGSHLALELFKKRAGIDMMHVPYKGNGPATLDLLAGTASAMFLQYAVAKPYVAAGRLRILATPSGERSPAMPNVPTIAESGLKGFDVQPWFGVVAPAGTPAAVVGRLNVELTKIMHMPDVKDKLSSLGAVPTVSMPQEFASFIDSEIRRWAEVVKSSGAKVE